MSLGAVLPDRMADWVAGQRWYQATGDEPRLSLVGGWRLEDPTGAAGIRTHLLLDSAGARSTLYQVPVTYRSAPAELTERALVGTVETEAGTRWVYDAPHDPAYTTALLRLILGNGRTVPDGDSHGATAVGHRHPSAADGIPVSSRVLTGEQSNTSIIFQMADAAGRPATPVICKVFRTLHHGENPDIVVQSALAAAGCTLVPPPVGHLSGRWRDASKPPAEEDGHLAFAQEFLPGVEDAWRVALRAAESSEDFTERAYSLGATTAEVHSLLATIMPTVPASAEEIAGVAFRMRRRLRTAVAEVPELAQYTKAVDDVIARAEEGPWPRLQRIHGDYHLGQVVSVPGRGWVLLDFEGEPLRPLAERSRPDLTLRDLAGMLRSFDYVAGAFGQSHPDEQAEAWAEASRAAFLDGYCKRMGLDLDSYGALLAAFEIDKALYESVYESRNRPAWLPIPVAAISRLVASS